MALTLVCSGTVRYDIGKIYWNTNIDYTIGAPPTAECDCPGYANGYRFLGISGTGFSFESPITVGSHRIDMTSKLGAILANWDSMVVHMEIYNSVNTGGVGVFPGATFRANWNVETHLIPIDILSGAAGPEQIVYSYNTQNDGCSFGTNPVRSIASMGAGAGVCILFLATPMGGGSCAVTSGLFNNNPGAALLDPTAGQCIYASGGVEPYNYSIIGGNLPCGESLDLATGCLVGIPSGCAGSDEITFQVIDGEGSTATVTCKLGGSCTATTIRNTVLSMIGDSTFILKPKFNKLVCLETPDNLLYYRGYLGRV